MRREQRRRFVPNTEQIESRQLLSIAPQLFAVPYTSTPLYPYIYNQTSINTPIGDIKVGMDAIKNTPFLNLYGTKYDINSITERDSNGREVWHVDNVLCIAYNDPMHPEYGCYIRGDVTDPIGGQTLPGIIGIVRQFPTVTWAKPAPITYGTPLGSSQLDATASVPGTFSYTLADGKTPATGAVLNIGSSQMISVLFTPNDFADYTLVRQTTILDVVPQAPTVTWAKPAPITYGTPLGSSQLDATASVPGTFSYTLADGKTPAAGAVLNIGAAQTLNVTFTPNDLVDYTPVTQTTTLDVNNPTIAGLNLNAYGDLQISGQLPSGNVISITPISGGWVKVTDNGVSAEFDASAINYIHYFGSLGGHDWFTNSIPLSGYVYAQMYGPGNTFVDSAQGTGAASYVILNGGYNTLIEAGTGHTYLWTNGRKTTDLLIGQNITIEN